MPRPASQESEPSEQHETPTVLSDSLDAFRRFLENFIKDDKDSSPESKQTKPSASSARPKQST